MRSTPFRPVLLCLIVLLVAVPAARADEHDAARSPAPTVVGGTAGAPVTPMVIDIDLRDLPAPRQWQPGDPIFEVPKRAYLPTGVLPVMPIESRDRLADRQSAYSSTQRGIADFTTPVVNFNGILFNGAGVPDTVGDVGLNHIIQSVNSSLVQIWDKAIPTPNLLTSFQMDSLGTGNCAGGAGDPVIIYDRQADRWVMIEFAGGNSICTYVSQTADPVAGGWYAYVFNPPSFPDYHKIAAWPTDANGGDGSYVMTANAGTEIFALERGPMLTGAAAGFQTFGIPNLSGFGFQAATPADIDGPSAPPTGSGAVIMRHRDTEVHGGPAVPEDLLEQWSLDVDWIDSGNSTITGPQEIQVAEFSSELCGLFAFACFEQEIVRFPQ